MPYIQRARYNRRPKAYGTNYRSTRRYPGMYRRPSSLVYPRRGVRGISRRQIQRVVAGMAEAKYWDLVEQAIVNTASMPYDASPNLYKLTGMAQSFAGNGRIGDRCRGSSLEIKFAIAPAYSTSQTTFMTWRFIVFIWKDDTSPLQADLLADLACTYVGGPVLAPLNHERKVKRKLLLDDMFCAQDDHSSGFVKTWNTPMIKKYYIPLKKLKNNLNVVNFQTASTTGVNHVYLMVVTNNSSVANGWPYTITTRYNYIDM